MTVVAIMQPTFLPWVGYFDLIDRSNAFVFLDDVQFSRQSWQQRNCLKTANGVHWITVPVIWRGKSRQSILDVTINGSSGYKKKHIETIKQNYSKSRYYDKYIDGLIGLIDKPYRHIVELNIDLISWVLSEMGIKTNLFRSSLMNIEKSDKVLRLVTICKKLGASHYLSPEGSKDYIEGANFFQNNNISVSYQDYRHPVYKQLYGEFVPYMSVIDLLFNEGENGLNVIRSGRNNGSST